MSVGTTFQVPWIKRKNHGNRIRTDDEAEADGPDDEAGVPHMRAFDEGDTEEEEDDSIARGAVDNFNFLFQQTR